MFDLSSEQRHHCKLLQRSGDYENELTITALYQRIVGLHLCLIVSTQRDEICCAVRERISLTNDRS